MKNIQIIDGAVNCVYDIFAATDEEFNVLFPQGTSIAFIDEICDREAEFLIDPISRNLWNRRVKKTEAQGIHGTIFMS